MTAGRTNHARFAGPADSWNGHVAPVIPPDKPNPPPPAPARFITRSDCSSCSIYADECPGPREDHCPITGAPQCP